MTEQTPLPEAKDIRDLLAGLLGRDVEVRTGAGMVDPSAGDGAMVGVYVDAALRVGALVLLDLPLAAWAGAAIALVPVPRAAACVDHGGLTDNLVENAGEILNVMAALVNADDAAHLRLAAVYEPGEPLPADVAGWVPAYVPRVDLDVAIDGYGSGGLSLLVL